MRVAVLGALDGPRRRSEQDISCELGEALARVSHHVRVLEATGMIKRGADRTVESFG